MPCGLTAGYFGSRSFRGVDSVNELAAWIPQRWEPNEAVPMPFGLGPTGDIIWAFLPPCRPRIAEIIAERIQLDIDNDSPLQELNEFDLFARVVTPFARSVLAGAVGADSTRDFRSFLRAVMSYTGTEHTVVAYSVRVYLVDWIMLPPYSDQLRELDPAMWAYMTHLLE